MATIGAQPGNQNAAKAKVWKAAIMRALERRTQSRSDGIQALDDLADKLLDVAGQGDMSALRELGDRLDGKAIQAQELSGPDGGELKGITVVFKSDS